MANHGPSYGLDAELKAKQDSKYDPVIVGKVVGWINSVTNAGISSDSLHEDLKSGVVLCKLANALCTGIVPKINNGKMPFIQMENINAFLVALKRLGVPDTDIFMTVDLFEAKNMPQVVQSLYVLGKRSKNLQNFNGPSLE